MLKKSMVLFLSLLLVFSCLPVTNVFAATAVVESRGTYVEDCEDGTLTAPFVNWGDYAVQDGVGKDGSKGLVGHRSWVFADFNDAMTTNDMAAISYDFKISKLPTNLTADGIFLKLGEWPFNGTAGIQAKYYVSTGKAEFVCGANTVAVDTSAWYHMVIIKESSANGSGKAYLMDDSGTLLLSITNQWMAPIYYDYDRFAPFNISTGVDDGAEIVVDNMVLDYVDQSTTAPALKSSSVATGSENVSSALKQITITLDQPLTTKAATLTPAGGTSITCTVAAAAEPMTYTVSWTEDLAYSKDYTLDISGSKNRLNKAAAGTIAFKTEAKPAINKGASVTETFEDGALDTAYFVNNLTGAQILEGVGKNGSKGLKVSANATGSLLTKPMAATASEQVAVSFDFKLTQDAGNRSAGTLLFNLLKPNTDGNTFRLCKDNDKVEAFRLGVGGYTPFEKDTWYRMSIANIGLKDYYFYIVNEAGYKQRYFLNATTLPNELIYTLIGVGTTNAAELVIDNIDLSFKDKATAGPALTYSSIANNATEVPMDTKTMFVRFDAPFIWQASTWLSNLSGVTMKSADGTSVPVTVAPMNDYLTCMDYKVTWQDDLEKYTTYTLDFSGAQNQSGASATGKVTFTTVKPTFEDEVIRDDFEISSYFTKYVGQYGDSPSGTSPFAAWNAYSHAGVTQTEGYTGYGAKIRKDSYNSSYAGLYTRPVMTVAADEKLVINFRMKINDAPATYSEETGLYTGGNKAKFGVASAVGWSPSSSGIAFWVNTDAYTGKGYIGQYLSTFHGSATAGRNGYYYTENHWYNMYWTVTQTAMGVSVVDEATGELVYENEIAGNFAGNLSFVFGEMAVTAKDTSGSVIDAEFNDGTEIILDDMAIWRIAQTDACKIKIKSELPEGAVIDKDNDTIGITFNQPMLPERTQIDVYEGEDCFDADPIGKTPRILYPDFQQIALDFSGLEYASSYTAELGGLVSVGGVGMMDTTAALSFATEADANHDVTIIGDVSASFNNGSLTATTLGLTLNNNTENTLEDVELFAAVYGSNDILLGIEKATPQDLAPGRNTATIPFAKNYTNACKVKVFVWNSLTSLKPLGMAEEDWGGATEVLFIGNSLSEDASKYLHAMARADGNTKLNFTVAAVGGSGLTHH
ncbi:MAG: Ig-like domain-containing protein, partial [Clostridia bacterium]|nr:Ig-like domain-containing protein [Clostridia bacterium]